MGAAPELPYEFAVPPDPRYLKDIVNRAYHQADPSARGSIRFPRECGTSTSKICGAPRSDDKGSAAARST